MAVNLNEKCEDAISSLTEEIEELKEEYNENQREIAILSSDHIKQALQVQNENENVSLLRNVRTKLAESEKEIKLFKQITGFEITKYLKKKVHKSENTIFYHHKLVGQSSILPFDMEFKTSESQPIEEPGRQCKVTQVNIHMDCADHPDLERLKERTETSMDLLSFFRLLSKYAEWLEFRRSTFTHFKETYPDAVGLPMGPSSDYMVLVDPDLPRSQLILVWKITINVEGAVIPLLDLVPKIPQQEAALDQAGVLEDAGQGFKNLLQVFGIQGSIEKIIQSFCLQKANVSS